MTQYNILNIKLSNSQLNKLKSGIKNCTEVTLKLSWNVVGDSYDKNKLFLTNTQLLKLCKGFANGSSANIKLSETWLHKIGQWGGSLSKLLGPLLKTGLSLVKDVLKSLAKSVLIPLGLTTVSAADAAIHKKKFGSGNTTLIISNEEMHDIIKKVKSVEFLVYW